MNATFPQNYNLPTYDDWVARTAWRDQSQSAEATEVGPVTNSVTASSMLKWIVGVVAYVIFSLVMAGTAIALAGVLLPVLLIAPAALAGLTITVAGYVLAFFGLMS